MHGSNTTPVSPGGNYLEKRNSHSGLLVAAVAIHVGVLGAILSYNPEIIGVKREPPLVLKKFPPIVPPKPIETPRKKADTPTEPQIARRETIVEQPHDPVIILPPLPPLPPMPPEVGQGGGTGTGITEAKPVLIPATFDPRFSREQQPPYPPGLERQEIEGSVTVRLQIGPDGRVTAVDLVRADHPDFFAATRDWALRKWRFKPATRDGVGIATSMTKTVQFKIVRGF